MILFLVGACRLVMQQLAAVGLRHATVQVGKQQRIENEVGGGKADQLELDPEIGAEVIGDVQVGAGEGAVVEHDGEVGGQPVQRRDRDDAAEGRLHQAFTKTLQQVAARGDFGD